MFNLAAELVSKSSRCIFLTGKAGTGKTTFLKFVRDSCPKQMAIVAPTGVAAINAGGVTIHSFFQLPFTPFIPGPAGFNNNGGNDVADIHSILNNQRLTREKRKVIQELELLIIDEISMVRCDVLDAIDLILRHVRHRLAEPFGGVQVLLIGDMYQLPPVVPDQEWRILREYYSSPYFFDSIVIKQDPPVYIEFEKIYRQSDQRFIRLLNQVRNNEMDTGSTSLLDNCFQPGFRRSKNDGYIILTTHNRKADATNELELGKLATPLHMYDALIEGEFSEKAYPADERLYIKAGAQVMFIKNDMEKVRRYYNGKIGQVSRIDDEKIYVLCEGESAEVEVKKETWQNIRYVLDQKTRKVEEEELGSFTQFPLRLAWAITIHKSQGLTFDKAIIDAGEAFAPGQVYVALSRCTSLSGMVLESRIRQSSLAIDNRIVAFSKRNSEAIAIETELVQSKRSYELALLNELFDHGLTLVVCNNMVSYVLDHLKSFSEGAGEWLDKLRSMIGELENVGGRFRQQLKSIYFRQPFDVDLIQDRVRAAVPFFSNNVAACVVYLEGAAISTDSGQHAREYNESMKDIFVQLSLKRHLLAGLTGGFSIDAYQLQKSQFSVPAFSVNAYGSSKPGRESPHPALYMQLKVLRDAICSKSDLPIFMVANSNTLFEMSRYIPRSLNELKKISGFGDAKVSRYGQRFLDVINKYCDEKGLATLIHEKTQRDERIERKKNKDKVDTKTVSYNLFRQGKTIAQIAAERSLVMSTIEGHLAWGIREGMIQLSELVSPEKLAIACPFVKDNSKITLGELKEKCGAAITFGELKMVLAWKEFQDKNGISNVEAINTTAGNTN